MTTLETVHTDRAPEAIGPYSQGAWAGDLFFSAGQIALDPTTGMLVDGGVKEQARQVFRNLAAVLDAAGLGFEHVVKTTVYLADMAEFAAVNGVYAGHFEAPYPARSTVAVRELPKSVRVEIDVVARRG